VTVYVVEIKRFHEDGVVVTWAGVDKDIAFNAACRHAAALERVTIMEFDDGVLMRSRTHRGIGSGWVECTE
jgi:hypothetical protein